MVPSATRTARGRRTRLVELRRSPHGPWIRLKKPGQAGRVGAGGCGCWCVGACVHSVCEWWWGVGRLLHHTRLLGRRVLGRLLQ
jgi:hypothetical protein